MTYADTATIFPLFSTPVYVRNDLSYDSKGVISILDNYEWKRTHSGDANLSVNQNILLRPELKNIKLTVEDNLHKFIFNILKVSENHELKHVCSWAICHEKNDFSPGHIHQNSMFSGVIYFKVPPNSGTSLKFINDYNNPTYVSNTFDPSIEEFNIFNSRTFEVNVDEKTIIIFPSHAIHATQVSQSEEKRYCISFNYILTGKYGTDTGFLEI
jgi:uncharacterized protein (TIGR02466 family)